MTTSPTIAARINGITSPSLGTQSGAHNGDVHNASQSVQARRANFEDRSPSEEARVANANPKLVAALDAMVEDLRRKWEEEGKEFERRLDEVRRRLDGVEADLKAGR
ncbi:MAG: hypothetical protein Q9159_007740 [Coniocarpon cinnabarinum]